MSSNATILYDQIAEQAKQELDKAKINASGLVPFYRDVFLPVYRKLLDSPKDLAAHNMKEFLLTEIRNTYDKVNQITSQATPNNLVEGTVLSQSWGHEQTNVDFFMVTKVTMKTVTMVPMTKHKEPTGDMTARVTPGRAKWEAKTIRRAWDYGHNETIRVNGEHSYQRMTTWSGKPKGTSSYA